MSGAPERVLLVFLDGVGVGDDDPQHNPLVAASLPTLSALCGGAPPTRLPDGAMPPADPGHGWVAADATLGVPGRPQSGTGQTSLLTGENAAAAFGRHFGPWVPTGLRDLLARRNLLSRTLASGRLPAFANAHPGEGGRHPPPRRPAAPPLAALGAGLPLRGETALRTGQAVASSITHQPLLRYLPDLPDITPAGAATNLAAIAREADLTLFAHYDTDLVGHRRDLPAAVEVLLRVDAFVAGLLDTLSAGTLLVIASDHGNVEDTRQGHTLNPVPIIAHGPGADELLTAVRSITDVTPALLGILEVE